MPGILYCSISRGQTVLCFKQNSSDNLAPLAESMLSNVPTSTNIRTSYKSGDQYVFHVIVQGGIVYLCATEKNFRSAKAFSFLDEILQRFTSGTLVVRATTARNLELQQDFSNVLSSLMNRFSKDDGDQITQLQSHVNEVKGVMTQNIDKVLQRGEKLEDLVDRTTDLEASTNTFMKTSRQVARKYWWQNLKMKIIIAAVIIVVLIAIILIILSQTGAFKSSGSSSSTTTSLSSSTTPSAPIG